MHSTKKAAVMEMVRTIIKKNVVTYDIYQSHIIVCRVIPRVEAL